MTIRICVLSLKGLASRGDIFFKSIVLPMAIGHLVAILVIVVTLSNRSEHITPVRDSAGTNICGVPKKAFQDPFRTSEMKSKGSCEDLKGPIH